MEMFIPNGYDLAHFAGVIFAGTLLVYASKAVIGLLGHAFASAAAKAKG